MPRYTRQGAVEDYLALYPEVAKRWTNRCVACGRVGYKPEMPDEARGAHFLKRELEELVTDDLSQCEVCAAALRP